MNEENFDSIEDSLDEDENDWLHDVFHSQSLTYKGIDILGEDREEAADFLEEALEIDPGNHIAAEFLRIVESEEEIEDYLEVSDESMSAYDLLEIAMKCFEINPIEAFRYLRLAVVAKPDLVDAHYNLGLIYEDYKQYELAKLCFKKVLEINPNHINAKKKLSLDGDMQKKSSDLQRDLIEKWLAARNALTKAKDNELRLRKMICSKVLGDFKEGTKHKLIDEWDVAAYAKINYSIDESKLDVIWDELNQMEKNCINRKPQLIRSNYRNLKPGSSLNQAIIKKQGLPTLRIKKRF